MQILQGFHNTTKIALQYLHLLGKHQIVKSDLPTQKNLR